MRWNFIQDRLEPGALLLDCRSENHFAAETIKGAFGAAVVKKPLGSGPKSACFLAGLAEKIQTLAKNSSSIICFDEGEGMYASRMAWILQVAGLKNVTMLGIKFDELPASVMGKGAGQIEVNPVENAEMTRGIATISMLQKELTRIQLIDARTPEEYEGILPRMLNPEQGALCGRIPGSINWDWRLLYGPDGHLKNKMALIMDIKRFGFMQERPTVIYDFNGARSCTAALVLSNCGYRQVSVYLGSWMEWRKTSLPKQNLKAFVLV